MGPGRKWGARPGRDSKDFLGNLKVRPRKAVVFDMSTTVSMSMSMSMSMGWVLLLSEIFDIGM